MFNKNTIKGFTWGVVVALIMLFGILPSVAYGNNYWSLLTNRSDKLSPYLAESSSSGLGAKEPNKISGPGDVSGQGFAGPPPQIVPAAAFHDDGGGSSGNYFFSFSNGYIIPNTEATTCLMAPVYFPDGATIENLYVYAYDSDASSNFTIYLRRKKNNVTTSAEILGNVTTSGASTGVQIPGDTSITSAVVDNSNYSYFLTTCLSSTNHRIHAAWIFYSEAASPPSSGPVFLPIVFKNFSPPITLSLRNKTGGTLNYSVYDDNPAGGGTLLCEVTIPTADTELCGTFPAGLQWVSTSSTGPGCGSSFDGFFKFPDGVCTRVVRCSSSSTWEGASCND